DDLYPLRRADPQGRGSRRSHERRRAPRVLATERHRWHRAPARPRPLLQGRARPRRWARPAHLRPARRRLGASQGRRSRDRDPDHMTSLKLSSRFSLPVDVVTEAIGIVATRGAGKSFTSAVLIEEAIAAGVPVVVLDPTGVYHGLRSNAAGDGP